MLGMDWMTENVTRWYFGTGKMCIQGVNVRLQSAASAKSCRKLVLARRSAVGPWSQVVVEGRVETNDLKRLRNTGWMTHPRLLEGGVMVGCVTVPGNKSQVPIVLLNSSCKKSC